MVIAKGCFESVLAAYPRNIPASGSGKSNPGIYSPHPAELL